MTKISLIRHGLVHNPAEVYYGRLPGYGLAALGRAQAAAAGDYLAGAGIVAVYHSPMLRAFQTAEIVRSRCAADAPLVECDLLNEIHSPFDGLAATEMEKRDWNFYDEINPPYEQPADIVDRLLRFFDLARQRHPGHHVVGVSHADPIAFAILWAADLSLSASQRKRLIDAGISEPYPSPASVTTFEFADSEERKLLTFRYHAPAALL